VSPNSEYSFPTTPDIDKACQELLSVYPLGFTDFALDKEDPPFDSELIPEQDEVDDEEFVTHLDPSVTDPIDDPDNLDPPSAPLPTHPNPAKSGKPSPPFCKVIQPKLRALLFSLFSQLPNPQINGRFFSPLFRYIVLASFGVDGKWAVSGDITQDIAALLFTGRLTLYSEMHAALVSVGEYESYHS
jgi:hypothetical protein